MDEASGHIRYTEKEEYVLALPIPKVPHFHKRRNEVGILDVSYTCG